MPGNRLFVFSSPSSVVCLILHVRKTTLGRMAWGKPPAVMGPGKDRAGTHARCGLCEMHGLSLSHSCCDSPLKVRVSWCLSYCQNVKVFIRLKLTLSTLPLPRQIFYLDSKTFLSLLPRKSVEMGQWTRVILKVGLPKSPPLPAGQWLSAGGLGIPQHSSVHVTGTWLLAD